MNRAIQILMRLQAASLRLYPASFRAEFEAEMQAVFAEAVAEASAVGPLALLAVCIRELRDWPQTLCRQHWLSFKQQIESQSVLGRIGMSLDVRLKRAFDMSCAALWLTLLSPLFLLIAALIKLDSAGPVFFRQERLGNNGRPFSIVKFRSMVGQGAGLQVTHVGRFLRRHGLDEIPQLLNVLRGDMSLVGPRPVLQGEIDLTDTAWQQILKVRPGITGLWQVSAWRRQFDEANAVALNLDYIQRRSLLFDLKIMLRTVVSLLQQK